MTKFILTIWVCSFLQGQVCIPPIESPVIYNSWYECSRAAHTESMKMIAKMGYKYVNDNKIAMSYTCREISSI